MTDNGDTTDLDSEVPELSPGSSAEKPARRSRVQRAPSLLSDFDPKDAEASLEDYAKQKDTSTQINKYLVIAAWFRKYKQANEIGPSHIYTCYQLLDWTSPDDIGAQFRQLKKKQYSYFGNGSKNGLWEITIVGLNEVDKMKLKGTSGLDD